MVPINKLKVVFKTFSAVVAYPGDYAALFDAYMTAVDVWGEDYIKHLTSFDYKHAPLDPRTLDARALSVMLLYASRVGLNRELMVKIGSLLTYKLVVESGLDAESFAELTAPSVEECSEETRSSFLMHMSSLASAAIADHKEKSDVKTA